MPEDLFGDSKTSTVGSKSKSDAKQMMKHMRIARQHPNASRFSAHEAAAGIMVNRGGVADEGACSRSVALSTRGSDQQRSGDGLYSRVTSAAASSSRMSAATAERLAAAQAPRRARRRARLRARPPTWWAFAGRRCATARAGADTRRHGGRPLAPPPPPGAGGVPEPLLVGCDDACSRRAVASTAPPSTTASELSLIRGRSALSLSSRRARLRPMSRMHGAERLRAMHC